MSTIDVIVAARTREADGIFSYELVRADGGALPAFDAGAHIDVHLGDQLVRQYSLCNPPGETHRYLIGVLRDAASRGGSQAMHERVQAGTRLTINAPKNHFPLMPAPHTLLLAGGIGITPILAMAEALAAEDAAFALHYCARSASLAAFRERILASRFAHKAHFHFDDAPDGKLDAAALLAQPDADARLYVCGPAGFIEHVLATARAQGWAPSQLHVEYFAGAAVDTAGDRAFDVELACSGKVVTVPAGRTVIQVLAEHGLDIPYSCEEGVCGTCLTRVLDGVPEHRDMYLTDEEHAANDQFTPCCSRARSARLVLDL
jgi:vanillate O-demethylase ferredoxin subunit